jgi:hypothetical protein
MDQDDNKIIEDGDRSFRVDVLITKIFTGRKDDFVLPTYNLVIGSSIQVSRNF